LVVHDFTAGVLGARGRFCCYLEELNLPESRALACGMRSKGLALLVSMARLAGVKGSTLVAGIVR
jgi:hypothetical protein